MVQPLREPRTAPAVISSPRAAARRGKYYVAATTRRRTRNDGSEGRRSARTMESERSELAGLNKMKEIEILNELKIESNTMTNPLDSRPTRDIHVYVSRGLKSDRW
jgi:hypothetical protein